MTVMGYWPGRLELVPVLRRPADEVQGLEVFDHGREDGGYDLLAVPELSTQRP
jgi:hypothetical protein